MAGNQEVMSSTLVCSTSKKRFPKLESVFLLKFASKEILVAEILWFINREDNLYQDTNAAIYLFRILAISYIKYQLTLIKKYNNYIWKIKYLLNSPTERK